MRISHLLLAALFLATPADAQEEAEEDKEVVVVGSRKEQVRDYVKALTDVSAASPIARFDWTSVCPGAAGLSEARNAAIAARMRQVAGAVGIEVAEAGCKPNALVIFAQDKKALIKALRKEHPIYFLDAVGRSAEIPPQPGPATAWHLEGRLDRSGSPVPIEPIENYYVLNTPVMPSRISASMRPIFLASVVVIELDSVVGLTTTQVADYAAMRVFAQADPKRLSASPVPTILTVLEAPMGSAVPASLTQWDLSYLKALYASAKNHFGPQQRNEIRRRMDEDVRRAQQRRQ